MATIKNGLVTTDFNNTADVARHIITTQPDNKLVVVGASNGDFALSRYNDNGSLDTSFGVDGKITTAIGSYDDGAWSVTSSSNGKLVVAGTTWNGSNNDFALVRYNYNGSLDTTFGNGGKVTTALGYYSDAAFSTVIQNNKILVAGVTYTGTSASSDIALVRYNDNGSLDTSFGNGGIVTTAIGSSSDYGYSVSLQQTDGKILVAGDSVDNSNNVDFALVRYNDNGSIDTGFGSNGKVITPIGSFANVAYSVIAQANGTILVAGYSYDSSSNTAFTLVRYTNNGTLDTSFSSDGIVTTTISGSFENIAQSVITQPNGKILVAGRSYGSNSDFALIRYNENGSLDTSFDGDGIVTTDFGFTDKANSITMQTDGKIVVVGASSFADYSDFALARYNSDGSLDTTFGASNPVNNNAPKLYISDWRGLEDATGHGVNTGTNASNYSSSVQVFLTAAATTDVTFTAALQYGTANTADVTGLSTTGQTFTIAAGQTSVAIPITLLRDYAKETPETFNVLLSNVTGATAARNLATGVIIDNDTDRSSVETAVVGTTGGSFYDFLATGSAYLGDRRIHTGIDVNGATGSNPENNRQSPVFGVVSDIGADNAANGRGVYITLPIEYGHQAQTFLLYHNTATSLVKGQLVRIGDVVGDFNPTAWSPHVHLESNTAGINKIGDWNNPSAGNLQDPRIPIAIADSNRSVSPIIVSGDTQAAAEPLGLMALGTTELYDAIGGGDASDWYRFYISDNSNFAARLSWNTATGTNPNPLLHLYNSDGTEITNTLTDAALPDGVLTSVRFSSALSAGEYFVSIAANASADTTYRLRLSNSKIFEGGGAGHLNTPQTGTDSVDDLIGSAGSDALYGLDGNDRLDGGLDADTMDGGDGDDVYVVDNLDDSVIETWDGALGGVDTVESSVSYTLNTNVENLTLTGTDIINGTGNQLDNVLKGNNAANTLNGDLGVDTMDGGDGNDIYIVDNISDVVAEQYSDAIAGNDTVKSSVNYILSDTIENIILTGSAIIDATGNARNNTLTGNSAANNLTGNAGADKLIAGAGNDILLGGLGKDNLNGGSGADKFKFIAITDSGITTATRDTVVDFKTTQKDKIDLSTIDADTLTAGNNAFASLTVGGIFSGAFANRGDLYFDNSTHILYGNNDTDKTADFSIMLSGVNNLTVADIIL